MLKLDNISVCYGSVTAIKNVNLHVEQGEIVCLIGSNGAGKSTTLRAISGLEPIVEGKILFKGEQLDGRLAEEITAAGVSHVPEGRRVFPEMSVLENLEMGAYTKSDKNAFQRNLENVYHHFPRLKERSKQMGGTMSGGEQQMLAMGRALMSDPAVVLMDEPTLGLAPIMCQEISHIIESLHAEGRTVVLVEQNARMALALADRGYLLDTGKIVLEGDANSLENDPTVKEVYLGMAEDL